MGFDIASRVPIGIRPPAARVIDVPGEKLLFRNYVHPLKTQGDRSIHGYDIIEKAQIDVRNVPRPMPGYINAVEGADKLDGFSRRSATIRGNAGAFGPDGLAQPFPGDDFSHGTPAHIGETDKEDPQGMVFCVFHRATSPRFISG